MTRRPALYTARWVLPVSAPPIQDGAVLIDETGRIARVGPLETVPAPEHALTVDLGEAILLPGLVNAHAHLELSVFRGFLEGLEFPDWIAQLLRAKRETPLEPEDFHAAARWSCIEALAAGITAIGATEDSDGAVHALIESGQRGVVFREVFGPSPADAGNVILEFRGSVARLREFETGLVRIGISPHSPYSVSDALFAAAARLAREEQLPVAVHIAESRDEVDLVACGSGVFAQRLNARGIGVSRRARSPIELLANTGVLDLAPLLIHAVHVDAADIARMAASGAMVAHCPAANARLGHGTAPVLDMAAAGVTIALGSDSVASNNRMDMLEEARLAQLMQRGSHGLAAALPSPALLRMVTLDGARALGIADRTGSLEAGKDADLCAVRISSPHVLPVHDPLATLFHSARASDVILTMVRGRVLYRDGEFLSMDIEHARSDIEMVATRLRRWRAAATAGPGPRT